MHSEVLACCDCFRMIRIVTLYAGDEGYAHPAGEEWIFAVGLLAASPARVAKNVDVGRPERQAVEDAVIAFLLGAVVLGARFGGDDVAHGVDHLRVPGRGHADGLWKDRGVAGAGDSVEGLVP